MKVVLPEVRTDGVPGWLAAFLRAVRSLLMKRFIGTGNKMNKAVTFNDLVEMGVVDQTKAQEQAAK